MSKLSISVIGRITCDLPSRQNKFGRPKLALSLTDEMLAYWCRYCHTTHLAGRAEVEEMWLQGAPGRITCSVRSYQNRDGKPMDVLSISESGVSYWCKSCEAPHLAKRTRIEAIWAQSKKRGTQCDNSEMEMPYQRDNER